MEEKEGGEILEDHVMNDKNVRKRDQEPESTRGSKRRKKETKEDGKQEVSDAEMDPEEERQKAAEKMADDQKDLLEKYKTGGVYIPPARLKQLMKTVSDKSSREYQRMTWDALRKSINGLINKVNTSNIMNIIPELFRENLVRGRGLLVRSLMKAQAASPTFTPIYAAVIAVINTKMPEIGELLLKRLITQFKRSYRRNAKPLCLSSTRFIAHLVNQQVIHEVLALQIMTLLLETPTDDSVEVAVGFIKEVGQLLADVSSQGLHAIFERFRGILHEGQIDKRVQFTIEGLFAVRKNGFAENPSVPEDLDIIEADDQITHELLLDDALDDQKMMDVFKVDPEYEKNEDTYKKLRAEILGEESGSDADDEEEEESSGSELDEEEEEEEKTTEIIDTTNQNVVNLRRQMYLTIMASLDVDECAHRLLQLDLEGNEGELVGMVLECCSQERSYLRFYGLIGARFCMLNKIYVDQFDEAFFNQYAMIHRLETNKLRNLAKLFAHLLFTDSLTWSVISYIHLNEEETTSSSRIFIKILFQELAEYMGLIKLNERLNDKYLAEHFLGILPKDNPRNTRFAINFFTSIGLGGLTEGLREHLRNAPKLILQQQQAALAREQESETSSSSGSESSTGSSSDTSTSNTSNTSSSDSSSDSSDSSDSSTLTSSSASSANIKERPKLSPQPSRDEGRERVPREKRGERKLQGGYDSRETRRNVERRRESHQYDDHSRRDTRDRGSRYMRDERGRDSYVVDERDWRRDERRRRDDGDDDRKQRNRTSKSDVRVKSVENKDDGGDQKDNLEKRKDSERKEKSEGEVKSSEKSTSDSRRKRKSRDHIKDESSRSH